MDAPESDHAIINRMAHALKDIGDLSITGSRLYHYRRAKPPISEEQIIEYDRRAKLMAEAELETRVRPKPSLKSIIAQIAGTTAMVVLGMFIVCLATDCADAAELVPAPSNTPMHIAIAVGLAFAIFAWVLVWAIDRIKIGPTADPDYRDDRDALARDREGGVL